MLQIRPEQFQIMRDKALDPSLTRLATELRKKLPDMVASFSEDELKRFCDVGAVKSQTYGIGTEYNVYRFVAAMLFFGEDFDTNPATAWAQEVLPDRTIDQDHKAKLLELRIAMHAGRGI